MIVIGEVDMKYLIKYKKVINYWIILMSIIAIVIINLYEESLLLKTFLSFFLIGVSLISFIYFQKKIFYFIKYLIYLIIFSVGFFILTYISLYTIETGISSFDEYLKGPTTATVFIVICLIITTDIENKIQEKWNITTPKTIKKQAKKEFQLIRNNHIKYYELDNKFSYKNATKFGQGLRLIVSLFLSIIGSSILLNLNYNNTVFDPFFYPILIVISLAFLLLSYLVIDWGFIISTICAAIIAIIILGLYKIYLVDVFSMFLVLITIIIFSIIPFNFLLYNYHKKSSRFFSGYWNNDIFYGVDLYYKNYINNKYQKNIFLYNIGKSKKFMNDINEAIAFIAVKSIKYQMFFVGFEIGDDIKLYFYTNDYIKPKDMEKYLYNYSNLIESKKMTDDGFKFYLDNLFPNLREFYHIKNEDLYYNLIGEKYNFENEATMLFAISFQKEEDFFNFVDKTSGLGYSILPFIDLSLVQFEWGIKLVVYLSTKLGLDKLNNNTDRIIDIMEENKGELLAAYVDHQTN